MINYKKSLLSLATILAIGSASVSADYIPLSKDGTNNKAWVLFGVNGFLSEGTSSSTSTVAGEFSITDNDKNTAKDLKKDNLYGGDDGISDNGTQFLDGSDSLGKVKSLTATTLQVRIDLTDVSYNERDPERIIYVSVGAGSPVFALKYRAALEGLTAQFSTATDGSNVYTFTIKSEYTYSNPAPAILVPASVDGADSAGTYLTKLSDIVDYNLTNDPASITYYDKTRDQDTSDNKNKNLRVYSYDGTNALWELYDSRNTAASNDFAELAKAKAYWARIDNNNTNERAGLVLGSSSLTAADYTATNLVEGWNLISFDANHEDLRVSTTGMILVVDKNTSFTIKDTTEQHSVVTDALTSAAATLTETETDCLMINQTIKNAEINGTMPATLNLKAFPIAPAKIALISNKRFTIYEDTTGTFSGDTNATTLAGQQPINATTLIQEAAAADFSVSGLQSIYGEYALIVKPLLGANTADDLNVSKLEVTSKTASSFSQSIDVNSTSVITATNITAITKPLTTTKLLASSVDIDYAGKADHVLIASNEPFYVRDHTFTRVFDFTTVNDTNGTIKISSNGTGDKSFVVDINGSITDVEGNITTKIPGVSADSNVSGDMKLYVLVDTDNGNEFYVTEGPDADKLKDATSTLDIAKGAVSGVYSLDYLAKRSLSNTIVLDLDIKTGNDSLSDKNDYIQFSINGDANTTEFYITPDTTILDLNGSVKADVITTFDLVTKNLKSELDKALILYSSVEHNCTDGNADTSVITIKSSDLETLSATVNSGDNNDFKLEIAGTAATTAEASEKLGYINSKSPDLSADLKYNAIYTPDYVTDGPLYMLRDAGFAIKTMVTGTTDLGDSKLSWESIDLTKKPSEWLDSQDYNLFSVDPVSGYWAYLAASTEATLAIANPNFKPSYRYHFNTDGTTFNSVSGNLAVEVTGLDEIDAIDATRASTVVNAYVAGTTVQLARTGLSPTYTGKISSYEIGDMLAGSDYEIFANVADGLGSNLKSASVGVTVDYKKPTIPTITETSGSFAFTSPDADVASFYIFKGKISEEDTTAIANNFLVKLDVATAAAYTLCDKLDPIQEFSTTTGAKTDPYNIKAFAVDGSGILGGGNASDIATKKYLPMLKTAMLLTDKNNDESDPATYNSNSGADAVKYTKSCVAATANDVNYGVTLTSESSYTTAKLAFNYVENRDVTATPVTMFIKNGDSAEAKITYPSAYGDNHERVYVEVGDKVFALKLQTADTLDGNGSTSDTAISLGGADTNLSKLLDGITF